MTTISDKREDIEKRLREHDAARKLIEAEMLALQHVCPHTNCQSWKDCGLRRST